MARPPQADCPDEDRARRVLWWLGGVSLAAYVAVLVLSFRFHYGEGHRRRPIIAVLALLAGATVCYLLALRVVLRRDEEGTRGGRLVRLVLGWAVAYRLVLLPSAPIQEIDYYRYLWDGRVTLAGLNPYRFAPDQVDRWGRSAAARSDLAERWRLSRESPALAAIFGRVHHREVPTAYPPASQAVFAVSALLTPAAAPLWAHVLILKALLLGFDLATLFLLVALLRQLRLPADWCLAYGWCPLALKEFANSGHLDTIAVFFTLLALFLLVRAAQGATATGGRSLVIACGAAVALGVAVLAKSYPIILVPVVAAYLAAWWRLRALVPLGVFAAVVVLGYLPFARPGPTPQPPATAVASPDEEAEMIGAPAAETVAPPAPEPQQPWTGLGTFLTRWEMNDFLFMLVEQNLQPPTGQPDHWFVVVPGAWRAALDKGVVHAFQTAGGLPVRARPAFLLTQALMGLILVGLWCRWAWRTYRRPEPGVLLRSAFLTLAWGWLLSSAPNPWYLLWCLPLMVFARRRSWFLLPGLVLLYYGRFWLEYHAPPTPAGLQAARDAFDGGLVWFEFAPFFVALLAESFWPRKHRMAAGSGASPAIVQPP